MQERKSERISLTSLDIRLKNLDAKFEQKLNALDAKFEQKFNALDAKLEQKLNALDAKLEQKLQALHMRIDGLEVSLRRMGVLLEEMNGKLSLLLEGYMGHDTRIVNLENWREKAGERSG
jgi:ABC-type phosphate transport system auxiliary subunit